jgi:Uma2 family endonuclease
VTPTPNTKHQRVVGEISYAIRHWLEDHPVGEVFGVPLDVVLSRVDVVEPDIQYVSHERADRVLTEKNVQGPPNLVVEVASPSTRKRDATIKLRLYERMGGDEYWIVDPAADAIHAYRRDGDAFAPPIQLTRGGADVLTSPLFPGLEIPLTRVFREPSRR